MTELDTKQLDALEGMRTAFAGADGTGLQMDDVTFLRYLRARLVLCLKHYNSI